MKSPFQRPENLAWVFVVVAVAIMAIFLLFPQEARIVSGALSALGRIISILRYLIIAVIVALVAYVAYLLLRPRKRRYEVEP